MSSVKALIMMITACAKETFELFAVGMSLSRLFGLNSILTRHYFSNVPSFIVIIIIIIIIIILSSSSS